MTGQMTGNSKAFEVWAVCSLEGHFPITVLEMLPEGTIFTFFDSNSRVCYFLDTVLPEGIRLITDF